METSFFTLYGALIFAKCFCHTSKNDQQMWKHLQRKFGAKCSHNGTMTSRYIKNPSSKLFPLSFSSYSARSYRSISDFFLICFKLCPPGSTLHGYLSKILARSCQDLGKILAKIVTRYCQELQDVMVRSYQESHVSKKNLTKKPNMARKILLRNPIWKEKNLKGSQQTSTCLQIYIVRH